MGREWVSEDRFWLMSRQGLQLESRLAYLIQGISLSRIMLGQGRDPMASSILTPQKSCNLNNIDARNSAKLKF